MIRVLDIPVACRVVTLVVDMALARSRVVLLATIRPVLCSLRLSVGHSTLAVVCSMLVLLVTLHFVLCSLVCWQARDARHQGWYNLLVVTPRCAQRQVPWFMSL